MARYDLPHAAPEPLRLIQRFVNTADAEHGREWLVTPGDLSTWIAEHGLAVPPRIGARELRRAHELREALRTLARANNLGDLGVEDAILAVNRTARGARLEVALDSDGAPSIGQRAGAFDGVLGELLAIAFRSMLSGEWTRLKACRQCSWVFYDTSRNRSATWCSMAICGNRAKTRAYRRRRRHAAA